MKEFVQMDQEEEILFRFVSGQHFNAFKEKFTTIRSSNKSELKKAILNFSSLKEIDDRILKNLTEEPFYSIFLNKILKADYSKKPKLLVNSLIFFFEAMEELFFWINDPMADYDTSAGSPDRTMLYNQLIPRLLLIKGRFNLDHNSICYTPILKKLSRSLNDDGSLVKTTIYRILQSYRLLRHSNHTIESLDRESVIDIFKENFEKVNSFSDMSRMFNGLKRLISTRLIKDFRLIDLLFAFLNKNDAKTIKRLNKLFSGGLKFELENSSKRISFSNQNVIFNFNKQVTGLQIKNTNLENVLFSIFKLKNLRTLNLLNAKIQKLPESIEDLTNLEILNLSNLKNTFNFNVKLSNTIQNLPESIGNLRKLKSLDLSGNPITKIRGLNGLKNLRELSFSECQITEIKNLNHLKNLKSLKLGNNQIFEIEGLESLTSLESLDLRNNYITEIKGLKTLTNLKLFCLLNNPVIDESDVFERLKVVKFRTKFAPSFEESDIQKLVMFCRTSIFNE